MAMAVDDSAAPSFSPDCHLDRPEQLARATGPVRVAPVFPVEAPSLTVALESQSWGLIEAVLVGHVAEIRQGDEAAGIQLGTTRIVAAETPE